MAGRSEAVDYDALIAGVPARRPSTSRPRGSRRPTRSSGCSSSASAHRALDRGEGAVLRPTRGRRPGFDPDRDRHARRPVARARLHRRRHPAEHRRPPAVGRLPGRDARRRARTSRCACTCRAARPGSRGRPSTRSGTAKSARCSPRARSTCRASAPATSCSTRGLRHPQRRFVFDEALYRWLNCVVITDRHGQRDEQRTPGGARHPVRGHGDPHHRRLPPPARRRGAQWATTRDRFQAPGAAEHRRPRALERRSVSSASTRTGSTRCNGCRWSARRTTGCTSSRTRSSSRSSIPRPASRCPTASSVDLHHRAVQDRQPAVPLQHHGPVVAVPARAVRVRQLAAQDGAVRRPAATTW